MYYKTCRLLIVCLPVFLAGGCEEAKSSSPLSPSIAGPISGVTISAPKLLQPAAGAQVSFEQQPITLMVANATSTGVRPLSYVFELSVDATFATKLFTQTGVAANQSGQTSLKMPSTLGADRTYYWRARAEDGANSGDYAAPASFKVYTPVVIQAPALAAPADGSTSATTQPKFTVTDSTHVGPVGDISYVLEVATDAAFSAKVVSVQYAETSGTTSWTPGTPLVASTRFYWHVKATDPGHESPWSATATFLTPALAAPAPIPIPAPIPGGSSGSSADGLDMSQASIFNNPPDLASWPVTANITLIDFSTGRLIVDFDRRDGGNRWPDVPFGTGNLEYTLGMCLNISGRWDCSAAIQFWYGRDLSEGGDIDKIGRDWFYDNRWGPMTGHQPAMGEKVGIFVAAGNLRDSGIVYTKERSNVVLIPFGTPYRR